MYKQIIDMNDILRKSKVESSRQENSVSESKNCALLSFFYFSVFNVVNYTGNYFRDLALFLFEQKVNKKLKIVFTLPYVHFGARTHDITPLAQDVMQTMSLQKIGPVQPVQSYLSLLWFSLKKLVLDHKPTPVT